MAIPPTFMTMVHDTDSFDTDDLFRSAKRSIERLIRINRAGPREIFCDNQTCFEVYVMDQTRRFNRDELGWPYPDDVLEDIVKSIVQWWWNIYTPPKKWPDEYVKTADQMSEDELKDMIG